mmetsp:Transcript_29647/g.74074  ORF Transcript_29647/g.74074 Transcript_29647/m.74074 type:complete len:201 (-) Transcript_29647:365-967(-)
MTPRMPGSDASLCNRRSAAAVGGEMKSGTGSARYDAKVCGCVAVEGGPSPPPPLPPPVRVDEEAPEAPRGRETWCRRRRRSRRSSSSNPTTRWSTAAAASIAATSAAAEPMSISGLEDAVLHRPTTEATARLACASLDGTSVPAVTLACFRPKIFWVATDAPVARSRASPRSPTEASAGSSTVVSVPRYVTLTTHSPEGG